MKKRLAILLALASPAAAATTVALKPEARVASGYVALADIADVRGEPLPATWLGQAPPRGETRMVTAADVRLELRKAGVPARGLTVCGECLVRGEDPDPRPGLDGFRGIAARAIVEAAKKALPGATVEAQVLDIDAPAGADFAKVEIVAVKPADAWWLGEARFRIFVNLGDTESAVWTARASLRGTRRAVLARRAMKAGHRVVSTDLFSGEAPAQVDGALTEESLAIGKTLACDLEENAPVTAAALRPGPLVLRGDEVVVTSGNGRATSRRTAVALEDGREGDVVRAKNPDSKKEFRFRVTGPGAGDAVDEGKETK